MHLHREAGVARAVEIHADDGGGVAVGDVEAIGGVDSRSTGASKPPKTPVTTPDAMSITTTRWLPVSAM